MDDAGFVWLASYPKSGNTYLRHLLEAYRCNGALDINNVRSSMGDAGAPLVRSVSPLPLDKLGFRGQALLRPAALMNYYARTSEHRPLTKTHWANLKMPDLPPFIPKEFTACAVYVVRDPRDVCVSWQTYLSLTPAQTVAAMADKDFLIGNDSEGMYAACMVSSWSNHVAGWIGRKDWPLHVVRYEDLLANPATELMEILSFLGEEPDRDRALRAAEAARIDKVQAQEKETPFSEHRGRNDSFFGNGGGSRWRDELAPKWVRCIERDHGDMMQKLGYETEQANDV